MLGQAQIDIAQVVLGRTVNRDLIARMPCNDGRLIGIFTHLLVPQNALALLLPQVTIT